MEKEDFGKQGCGQEHFHHHNHSQVHEHADDHGHGHCHDDECAMFHVTHHEESLIGSVHGRLCSGNFEKAQELLKEQIRILGQRISQQGGIIGHIKFIVSSPEHCCQISLTDTDETTRFFDLDSCRVEGVAIVFLVEEHILEQLLHETLGTILQENL